MVDQPEDVAARTDQQRPPEQRQAVRPEQPPQGRKRQEPLGAQQLELLEQLGSDLHPSEHAW